MTKYKTYIIGQFLYDKGIYYSNDGYNHDEKIYSYTSSLPGLSFRDNTSQFANVNTREMCEYCKHQYVEDDVVNGKIDDPCEDCDGICNFDLSDDPKDKRKYYDDYEDPDEYWKYDDEIDLADVNKLPQMTTGSGI